MPGTCSFQDKWLEQDKYKNWLRKHQTDKKQAFCALCKKSISLSAMGEGALTSHVKGKTHKKNESSSSGVVYPMDQFCSTSSTASTSSDQPMMSTPVTDSHSKEQHETQSTGQQKTQGSMNSHVTKTDVLKAEILWAMKCIDSHYSMNSCADIGNLFKAMFPDSGIAQGFASADKKTAYLCTHGLGPYFSAKLLETVQSKASYTLLFDETLNHELQEKQMDVYVRIWDVNRVVTSYFDSQFLGHATANDMFDRLSPLVTKLGHRQLIQLSMDGPSVN